MIELRRFERTLKLRIERKELGKMKATQQQDADSDYPRTQEYEHA